jgi:hypothetical protein
MANTWSHTALDAPTAAAAAAAGVRRAVHWRSLAWPNRWVLVHGLDWIHAGTSAARLTSTSTVVDQMKAKCHAEHDANHCMGFSGGGVAPGGELRSGCFRACSPDLLVKGIVLDAGGDCRAYVLLGGRRDGCRREERRLGCPGRSWQR